MSHNRLKFEGLTELRTALRHLPDELTTDAGEIVQTAATGAERAVVAAYPEGPTGNLRRRVSTEKGSNSRFGAAAVVRSRAPHAHIFEKGTGNRQTSTGANRGRMPEAPQNQQMIPIVMRFRRTMTEQLIALVERAGFQVQR